MILKNTFNTDHSAHINIRADMIDQIPVFKIDLEFDPSILLEEFEIFRKAFVPEEKLWFERSSSKEKVYNELTKINLLNHYEQYQMCEMSDTFPWQTCLPTVGEYTKNLLSTMNIHRPRYVTVAPGWKIKEHRDWTDNRKQGLRCHLIMETNPLATHTITDNNGKTHVINFKAGELWFLNASMPHWAENGGDTTRKGISFDLVDDTLICK